MYSIHLIAIFLIVIAPQRARTAAFDPALLYPEAFRNGGTAGRDLKIQDDFPKTIDAKFVAKLAASLSSKKHDERTAALATLTKLLAANKGVAAEFEPLLEP